MLGSAWRKSSYSDTGNCLEAALRKTVRVRDTKNRRGGELTVAPAAWSALLRKLG
ncbi:DUF397 domain-containing protein [Amycolatopsis sp. FDAARGOS 1241]|uniref:DUF397 domain-containing protein n=1 Tax=Amycolatopsis sp. FDAARGOS 1241 TaxID=2778070 RepID=UPI001950F674|nr:DUF397 domain-containing protein [Amycolatopsis sp. FDAARGOS 1241]QRP50530.1 DUF397 domain-containing protein [Amycolatopsis sp. FDAARGOS 1241]